MSLQDKCTAGKNNIGVYKLLILRYCNTNIRFFSMAPSKLIALVIAIAGMQFLYLIEYSDMFSFTVCFCIITIWGAIHKRSNKPVYKIAIRGAIAIF